MTTTLPLILGVVLLGVAVVVTGLRMDGVKLPRRVGRHRKTSGR